MGNGQCLKGEKEEEKVMLQICNLCKHQFNGNTISYFCSNQCEKKYWDNPIKIEISTKCPQCQQLFKRYIYTLELCSYQALTLCGNCNE